MFPDLVGQITTEDSKKIRELVRNAAIREDRKLTPRELENVAVAAEQILKGLDPLFKQQAKATGAKKGAISKHINRILDALLEGGEIPGGGRQVRRGRRHEEPRPLARARQRAARRRGRHVGRRTGHPRVDERPLPADRRKIHKEDLDAIIQWALKVREMYLDIESRRGDAREASVDSVNRLEQTWLLFKDLEPKLIVNDEQLFRESRTASGRRTASASTFAVFPIVEIPLRHHDRIADVGRFLFDAGSTSRSPRIRSSPRTKSGSACSSPPPTRRERSTG